MVLTYWCWVVGKVEVEVEAMVEVDLGAVAEGGGEVGLRQSLGRWI